MNYRVAKNRRKHRTHRPEKPKARKITSMEPMIFCKPSGRIIAESEYVAIYQKELAARDAYWQKHAGPYHPRLGR